MLSEADRLQERTSAFAVSVIRFVRTLPRQPATDSLVRQLSRSAGGIAGNYRAARRARSRAEFIARLGVVVEEADETAGWLQLLRDSGIGIGCEMDTLSAEAAELLAIFSKSFRTARANHAK